MATAQSQSVASAVSSLQAVGHWRRVHVQRRQLTPLALFEAAGRAAGAGRLKKGAGRRTEHARGVAGRVRRLYLREYQPRPAQMAMMAMMAIRRPAIRLPRFMVAAGLGCLRSFLRWLSGELKQTKRSRSAVQEGVSVVPLPLLYVFC